ncbi:ABC transporter ATP-binding protein [Palleronia sp. LCG004]|uniref:energy-coupling factor ABC transporter ATP-binding protein n=1 Tax=Palleronia sp. LCG004 TaxID=3079304 RepID=UPI0029421890|nr:ABC transporter ATP-binding protein [Palleronia sp. LCG004]WOI56385.1 ABC transporter ATP-binding protein [Palleronia sp. LCG004]
MTDVLDLREVGYVLDGQDILRGVTLATRARRIGIVGRNGSGKSTLARALAGLVPVEGHLRIEGVDVMRDRRAALVTIGLLFQNPDHQIIFPTVAEELRFGLRQQGLKARAAENRVAETLARFGKSGWGPRSVNDLSHGQKQLVCLMAILAMQPRVIVLDEPFSGLDIPTRMQLARRLGALDAALVHISHAPEDLADYEHVIWIDEGRVMAEGGPEVLDAYAARMREIGARDD